MEIVMKNLKKSVIVISTALAIHSTGTNAEILVFTPSGTSTVTQGTNLFWDMRSPATSTSSLGAVGGFFLSDHGDFHYAGPTNNMVVTGGTSGAILTAGTEVGVGSVYSVDSFTGTTNYGGTMMAPSTAYYGLRFVSGGQTYYGWLQFTEGATDQSLLAWAYETSAGVSILAGGGHVYYSSSVLNNTPAFNAARVIDGNTDTS